MKKSFRYEVIDGWEKLPPGYVHGNVQGVRIDSQDCVYLVTRRDTRVIVYHRDGTFIRSWGEDIFTPSLHWIEIGPDDSVYISDSGDHTIRKFDREGKQLMVIGTPGLPSDTGYDNKKGLTSITHGGPPFNRPANVAIGINGDIYVTDGYGNSRIHRFSSDGTLIQSWGAPGIGPGQFMMPHGICVAPDGRILVGDRENDRIQIFTEDGKYLDQWTHVQRPTDIFIDQDGLVYVTSLRWNIGNHSYRNGTIRHNLPGHISIHDLNGSILWRCINEDGCAPGNFFVPHAACVDSHGDLYVGEVSYTSGVSRGLISPECHTFQKLARK
jgi:sugar lactone lactonase YvrE